MRDLSYHARLSPRTRALNVLRGVFRLPLFERALRRCTMDAAPGSLAGRLVPPEYTYPKGSWRSIVWKGLRLKLDLSNANDHGAYFGLRGTVDEVLLEVVGPGATVIDIGANIGIYALTFGLAVKGGGGRVIAFEPHPVTFQRLREHLDLNPGLPVEALPLGIGASAQLVRLYEVDPTNSGMNRIMDGDRLPAGTAYHEIRIGTLREALGASCPSRIDLIKIDVEGSEMGVLRGSEDLVRSHRPVLFIELDDANLRDQGCSARELVNYVEDLGYRVEDGATGRSLPRGDALRDVQIDILCRPVPTSGEHRG